MYLFDVSIIIHATIFLSFLFAVGLLLRPWRFRNVVLSIFIAELGYMTLFVSLLHTQEIAGYPNFFLLFLPVETSMGPLLYLYVLSFLKNKQKFHTRDLVHFVPLLLVSIGILFVAFEPYETKQELVKMFLFQEDYRYIQIAISIIAIVIIPIIYIILSIRHLWFRKPSDNPAYQTLVLLISLLVLWLVLGIVGIAGSVRFTRSLLELLSLLMSLVVMTLYLLSFRYPYLLQFGSIPLKKKRYAKSYLDTIDQDTINRQLRIILEEEKLFCDEDLSLGRLSQALELSKNQLSQFLNSYHKKNFNTFVNTYRVEEAKKILLEEPDRQILSIALAVGFNSYSAFHAMFKKLAGISPVDYRRKFGRDVL